MPLAMAPVREIDLSQEPILIIDKDSKNFARSPTGTM
jgi:hypothetical protein